VAILVFDSTRKLTYRNLQDTWYPELRKYRENIPVLVIANKIDENQKATTIKFGFPAKHGLYMNYTSGRLDSKRVRFSIFCSAADGRNVVQVFHDALRAGVKYKKDTSLHSFSEMITQELEDWDDSDEDES
jgi:Rab-like protein 2